MREPTGLPRRDALRRRLLRAAVALAGAAWTLRPGTAFAAWGEDWGAMVWGAGAPPAPVPLLGVEGLLLLAVGLALSGSALLRLARRRRA